MSNKGSSSHQSKMLIKPQINIKANFSKEVPNESKEEMTNCKSMLTRTVSNYKGQTDNKNIIIKTEISNKKINQDITDHLGIVEEDNEKNNDLNELEIGTLDNRRTNDKNSKESLHNAFLKDELIKYRKIIEKNYLKSKINRTYRFPLNQECAEKSKEQLHLSRLSETSNRCII